MGSFIFFLMAVLEYHSHTTSIHIESVQFKF